MDFKLKNSTVNATVCEERKQEWIEEGINRLKDSGAQYTYSTSGDSVVIIIAMHEEDGGGYEIFSTSNFDHGYYENKVFN